MTMTHKWAAPCWRRIGTSLLWPEGTLSGAAYCLGGLVAKSALGFDRGPRWHVSVSKVVEGRRVLPSDEDMRVVREDFDMRAAEEDNAYSRDGLTRHLWLRVKP